MMIEGTHLGVIAGVLAGEYDDPRQALRLPGSVVQLRISARKTATRLLSGRLNTLQQSDLTLSLQLLRNAWDNGALADADLVWLAELHARLTRRAAETSMIAQNWAAAASQLPNLATLLADRATRVQRIVQA